MNVKKAITMLESKKRKSRHSEHMDSLKSGNALRHIRANWAKTMARFNEHEMNIDSGDERPEAEFKQAMKIADKAGRGRKPLRPIKDDEAYFFQAYVDGLVTYM